MTAVKDTGVGALLIDPKRTWIATSVYSGTMCFCEISIMMNNHTVLTCKGKVERCKEQLIIIMCSSIFNTLHLEWLCFLTKDSTKPYTDFGVSISYYSCKSSCKSPIAQVFGRMSTYRMSSLTQYSSMWSLEATSTLEGYTRYLLYGATREVFIFTTFSLWILSWRLSLLTCCL